GEGGASQELGGGGAGEAEAEPVDPGRDVQGAQREGGGRGHPQEDAQIHPDTSTACAVPHVGHGFPDSQICLAVARTIFESSACVMFPGVFLIGLEASRISDSFASPSDVFRMPDPAEPSFCTTTAHWLKREAGFSMDPASTSARTRSISCLTM